MGSLRVLGAVAAALVMSGAQGPLFLADTSSVPHAAITWPTRAGDPVRLEADRAYASPDTREVLGRNLECFVALGGTRLDKGAGHPDGVVLRIGFYKRDAAKPLFDDLAPDATITVELSNVKFSRRGTPRPESVLQHLKYSPEGLASCGLGGEVIDCYNTASRTDTLGGKVPAEIARLGILDGTDAAGGRVAFATDDDGRITMTAKIPYALLRHVKDPWLRTEPGTFLEPVHFHVEVEVLPQDAAGDPEGGPAGG